MTGKKNRWLVCRDARDSWMYHLYYIEPPAEPGGRDKESLYLAATMHKDAAEWMLGKDIFDEVCLGPDTTSVEVTIECRFADADTEEVQQ